MNKKTFWALAKKEFFGYINTPQAYVVMVPFVILSTFLYFRSALMMGDANLRYFIELTPWFLIVVGPAIAMKSFADEYRKDTLELLFAHPVSDWTVALSKFAGLFLFYGVFLAGTLALPLSILLFSQADPGLMLSQYVAALMIGGAFLAVGMTASIYAGSAVGGFLVGAAINFGLMLLGMQFVVMMFPGILGMVVNELALSTHITTLSRGVLDIRDILYFVSLIAVALSLVVMKLSSRTLSESPKELLTLRLLLALIVTVAVAGNVFMAAYPIRLDLTSNRQFSLSQGTKQLLKDVPDRLTITLYTSRNLPAQMQVTLRETGDWMKDFSRYGNTIVLKTVYTDSDPKLKEEALKHGIQEAQFNQIGSSSFQVQTGFLGLRLQYADKSEVIPFIEDAGDMEHQLSRLIIRLTQEQQPRLGLVEAVQDSQTTMLAEFLNQQYEVVRIYDSTDATELAGLSGMIVIDDGGEKNASTAALLSDFIAENGNALFFIDGVNIDQRSLQASASDSQLIQTLSTIGVKVNSDIVYDVQLNEAIQIPAGNQRVIINYPFWMRGLVQTKALPWPTPSSNILLGWPSSLEISAQDGAKVQQLIVASQTGGQLTEAYDIDPNNRMALAGLKPSGKEHVIGVIMTKSEQRVGVVADHHMVTDDFLKNSVENQTFVANFIDWTVADPILSSIPKRASGRNVFQFTSNAQAQAVQYGSLLVPPILIAGFGFWWLKRRRRLSQRTYQ
jgi:ABC-type uncharacterized transport system involved in gliding motility auxiliary subunit